MSKADEFLWSMKEQADALIRDDKYSKELLFWARDMTAFIKGEDEMVAIRSYCVYFALNRDYEANSDLVPESDAEWERDKKRDRALELARSLSFTLAPKREQDSSGQSTIKNNKQMIFLELKGIWFKRLYQTIRRNESYIGIPPWFGAEEGQPDYFSNYLYANQLIVDCLNCGINVSESVREEILDQLLIPPGV